MPESLIPTVHWRKVIEFIKFNTIQFILPRKYRVSWKTRVIFPMTAG